MLNPKVDGASLYVLSVLRFGFKRDFLGKKVHLACYIGDASRFLLFRINLDLLIRNPLNEICYC